MLNKPFGMVLQDLNAVFRPQRQWAEGQGLWLIVAFFLSGIGAGTWILSTPIVFHVPAGRLLGFVLLVVGSGAAHLAFLGHPLRAWRMVRRFRSSWVSRGIVGMTVFTISAALYLLSDAVPGLPWLHEAPVGQVLLTLSIVGAVWVTVYKGFVFAVSKAIPFWNSPVLPALFLLYALRGGLAVLLLVGAFGTAFGQFHAAEVLKFWVVASSTTLLGFYLWIMSDAGVTARQSVHEILNGSVSAAFYAGVVAVGILVPLAGGAWGLVAEVPPAVIGFIGICSLIGDFYIVYSAAKAGIYVPLVIGTLPVEH